MAFDISTARPEGNKTFDMSTAQPEDDVITQPVVAQADKPQGNLADMVIEPLKAIGGAIGGSIAGGWTGIYDLISTGDIDSATKALNDVRDKMSLAPKTQEGESSLRLIQKSIDTLGGAVSSMAGGTAGLLNVAVNPISNIQSGLQQASDISGQISDSGIAKTLGEGAFQKTGNPLVATAAEMIPDIAGVMTGKSLGKSIDNLPDPKKAILPQDALVDAGKSFDVPLLTSDVYPPTSFLGKWVSGKSDQMGALGSGSARVSQQKARVDVLEGLAREYNVSIDSPFFEDIVKSLSDKNAKVLERGNIQRRAAIDSLTPYGEVSFDNTALAVKEIIDKELRLGDRANQGVIKEAESYLSALNGKNFDDAAAIRTRLIQQQKDLEGSSSEVKTPSIQSTSRIKSAIDEDLLNFARKNDEKAASNWLKANRNLSEQLTTVKRSELKRLIDKGDVKPEMISTVLRSGKRSELKRLAANLGQKGKQSVRAAIVKDLLDKSGLFKIDSPINVNKFTTELSKTNTKQAIDVFFTEGQKSQFSALERLMDATRRAQEASVNTKTGQELVPLGAFSMAGYGLNAAPLTTLAVAGTTSAALKAYESKPFRTLLTRIARTKRGSAEEKKIFEVAIPAVYAAQQAAKEQQEKKQ